MGQKYSYEQTPRGYAIYCVESDGKKAYISDHLTLKQAKNWTERLNQAFLLGVSVASY